MITLNYTRNNGNTSTLGRAIAVALGILIVQSVAQSQEAEQFRPLSQFLDDDNGSAEIVTAPDGRTRYEIRSGYAVSEGDIVIGKISNRGLTELLNRGVGRTGDLDLWLDGIVYYQKSPTLPAVEVTKVDDAIAHWNAYSSLKFVERTPELASTQSDYIMFEPSGGCASWVGRIGGEQAIWVGETCTTGSVIHEIGHAIGLFHEHTRSDRDNFINVQWENIVDGKAFNFDVLDAGAQDLGDYDYASVMHYGATFFSRNGDPTILAPDGVQVGQRIALSQTDLDSVNALYSTDLLLTSSVSETGDATRVSVVVDNIGLRGANTITVSLPMADTANAARGFAGTGWNCTAQVTEISCSLEQLAEGAQSQLLLDMVNGSIDNTNTGLWLESRTFDTDLSNNGQIPAAFQQAGTLSDFDPVAFNNGENQTEASDQPTTDDNSVTDDAEQGNEIAALEETDADGSVGAPNTENTTGSTDTEENTPTLGQALPDVDTDAGNTPVASSSGGGGAVAALLPALLWPAFFRRRRQR